MTNETTSETPNDMTLADIKPSVVRPLQKLEAVESQLLGQVLGGLNAGQAQFTKQRVIAIQLEEFASQPPTWVARPKPPLGKVRILPSAAYDHAHIR